MSLPRPRAIPVLFFGAGFCLAASLRSGAAVTDKPIAQLVGRALSVDDASDAGRIDILIVRWSSDEEVEDLRKALAEGKPGIPPPVFRKNWPPAGVVLMPGIRGGLGARVRQRREMNVQFAREIKTPAGRQVVIATDQLMGLGEDPRKPPPSGFVFTLLDIRFGPDGRGVGKVASVAGVSYDKDKKIVEIKDFAAQPVRLSEVRLEKR